MEDAAAPFSAAGLLKRLLEVSSMPQDACMWLFCNPFSDLLPGNSCLQCRLSSTHTFAAVGKHLERVCSIGCQLLLAVLGPGATDCGNEKDLHHVCFRQPGCLRW